MVRAIRERITVQPGGLVEMRRPDLPTGATVEVIVMIDEAAAGPGDSQPPPLASLFGTVRECFETGEEADAFIRAERNAWPQ